jgi:hypothetical protein
VRPGDVLELAVDNTELHFFEPDAGLALDIGTPAPQLA